MLLFGPATEDATYAMIAPALAFALVQAFQQKTSRWMRVLVCASFAILLLGLILNAFFGLKKTPVNVGAAVRSASLCRLFDHLGISFLSLGRESGGLA